MSFHKQTKNFCTKLLGSNLYIERGEIAPKVILHYHILHFFNLLLCQIWRLYSFSLIPESKHLKTLVDLDQLGIKLCFGLIRFFVSFNANGVDFGIHKFGKWRV